MKKLLSIVTSIALIGSIASATQNQINITGHIGGGAIVAFGDQITDEIIDGELYFQGWDFDLGDLTQYTGTDRYIYVKSNIPTGVNMTINDYYYGDGAMRSSSGGVIPVTYLFDGYDDAHIWPLGESRTLTTAPTDGTTAEHFFSFQTGDTTSQPPGDYYVTLDVTIAVN